MLQAELVKQRSDDDAGSASSSSQKQALASLELEDYKRTVGRCENTGTVKV